MTNQREKDFNNEVVETRKLIITSEHAALLVWGISAGAIGMLIYVIQTLTGDLYGCLWIALPVIASPLQWYVDRKRPQVEFTPLYRMLRRIGIITMALIAVTALLTIPYSFNVYFVITLILTIWCGLTGYMIDYPRLLQLDIRGLAITIALHILSANTYQLPVFIVGLGVTLIAPGLDMLKRIKSAQL